jgi:hypothetical protein
VYLATDRGFYRWLRLEGLEERCLQWRWGLMALLLVLALVNSSPSELRCFFLLVSAASDSLTPPLHGFFSWLSAALVLVQINWTSSTRLIGSSPRLLLLLRCSDLFSGAPIFFSCSVLVSAASSLAPAVLLVWSCSATSAPIASSCSDLYSRLARGSSCSRDSTKVPRLDVEDRD